MGSRPSEFISKLMDNYQCRIERDLGRPCKPTDNACIKSFNRSGQASQAQRQ